MADSAPTNNDAAAPAPSANPVVVPETKREEPKDAPKEEVKPVAEAPKEETKKDEEPKPAESSDQKPESATETAEKPQNTATDAEAKDATEAPATEAPAAETPSKTPNRRKSTAGAGGGKGLSRKASKAKLTHTDAKPGDHFLIKLKGFPPWPAVICDEDMLPPALLNNRPVSAARPDGTYAEAYADGGKRPHDRTFPVMYLFTNEFGWEKNTTLTELSAEKAKNAINDKMRKDLKAAYELAAEHHPIDHYKGVLKQFEEEQAAIEEAARQAEIARLEAAATPKKTKKAKKAADDEDTEMADADSAVKPKTKKRKAEDETSTPQRTDSAKKPKIKLNTSSTPKAANGAGTPKATKEASAAKPKEDKKEAEKKAAKAKMSPEERRERKQKEVLFLRHKLQKGLLTGPPDESEMKSMSVHLGYLEEFSGLEASMIRATKINKVLKGILKLENIPHEEEHNFKKRSQTLLNNWNTLLADAAAAAPAPTATNGVNGDKKATPEVAKSESEKPTTSSKPSEEPKPAEAPKAEPEAEAKKSEEKAAVEAPAPAAPVAATD